MILENRFSLYKRSVFNFTRLIKTVANCLISGIKSYLYDLESVSYDSKNHCAVYCMNQLLLLDFLSVRPLVSICIFHKFIVKKKGF